jgi:hypothetical protein
MVMLGVSQQSHEDRLFRFAPLQGNDLLVPHRHERLWSLGERPLCPLDVGHGSQVLEDRQGLG